MSSTTRIRVRTPPQLGSHNFWYLYLSSNFVSAGELLDGILQEIGLYNLGLKLGLYLRGYEILPATSLDVVRNGDVVFVRLLDGEGEPTIEHDYDVEKNDSNIEEGSDADGEEYEQEVFTSDEHGDRDEEKEEDEDDATMSVKDQANFTNPGQGEFSPAPSIKYFLTSTQNALVSLSKLSVDVLVEVASFGLTSRDVLALAWTSKHFSHLLLSSSAIHVWQMAERQNPTNVPPRPRDLSPPSFAALIFFNYCSMCGRPVENFHRSDLYHRMRLCNTCRIEHTLPLDDRCIGFDLVDLVPRSKKLLVSPFSITKVLPPYVLRREVQQLRSKLSSLKAAEDVAKLKIWKAEKSETVARRLKEGQIFLNFWETREKEIKIQRRKDVEARLFALGWSREDFGPAYGYSTGPWGQYVDLPKPLLETEWTRIYTQLRPSLESRREHNISERRHSRRIRLNELLHRGKQNARPYLEITNPPPPTVDRYGASSTKNSIIPISFPQTATLFEYGFMKELVNMDVGAEEAEDIFVSRFSEVVEAVRAWRAEIEADLAKMLREGRELDGIPPSTNEPEVAPHPDIGDLPPFNVVLGSPKNPNENQISDLRPDSLLLLRADSVFRKAPSPDRDWHEAPEPLFYPDILDLANEYGSNDRDGTVEPSIETQWDISMVRHYGAAETVARALLKCLGRPNVLFIEIKALGARLTCGRCHMDGGKTWAQMIAHYVNEAELWMTYYLPAQEANFDITYNYVHDTEAESEAPLIKAIPPTFSEIPQTDHVIPMEKKLYCKLCKGSPWKTYSGSAAGLIRHVKDVHSIPSPQKGVHYGKLGFFEEGEDSS